MTPYPSYTSKLPFLIFEGPAFLLLVLLRQPQEASQLLHQMHNQVLEPTTQTRADAQTFRRFKLRVLRESALQGPQGGAWI